MKALELVKEYRKTMPPDLMHLWAADSVLELISLAEVNAELLKALEWFSDIGGPVGKKAKEVIAKAKEQQ